MELMPESEDSVFNKTKEELDRLGIDVLPGSLGEAVVLFKKSGLMKDLLGEELFRKFAETKEREAEEYRVAVTDWEIGRYLEAC